MAAIARQLVSKQHYICHFWKIHLCVLFLRNIYKTFMFCLIQLSLSKSWWPVSVKDNWINNETTCLMDTRIFFLPTWTFIKASFSARGLEVARLKHDSIWRWAKTRGLLWAKGLYFALLFMPVGVTLFPDHAKTQEVSVVSLFWRHGWGCQMMVEMSLGKKYYMFCGWELAWETLQTVCLIKMPESSLHEVRNCVCEEWPDLICVQRFALKLDAYCSSFQVWCVDICMY